MAKPDMNTNWIWQISDTKMYGYWLVLGDDQNKSKVFDCFLTKKMVVPFLKVKMSEVSNRHKSILNYIISQILTNGKDNIWINGTKINEIRTY